VIKSTTQFQAPPPPALTSAAYTAAYNEAKNFGGDGSNTPTQRTSEQTFIGTFWAYDGTPSLCAPPRLYNQITVHIADQTKLRPVELARLLALVNVAMADTAMRVWESKYYYDFWRPVTDPRIRPRYRANGRRRWQRCHSWRSYLHPFRRARQQSERAELHSAFPCLSFRPRRVWRGGF
jgi:hypothetical protein